MYSWDVVKGRLVPRGMNQMATPVHCIDVLPKTGGGMIDSRGESVRRQLMGNHNISTQEVRSTLGYLVKGDFTPEELQRATTELFSDPIIEDGNINQTFINTSHFKTNPDVTILVGFKPGVTDNRAQAALDGLKTLFPEKKDMEVSTTTGYMFWGVPDELDELSILRGFGVKKLSILLRDMGD